MDPRQRQSAKRAAKPALSNEEKFRAVCRVTKDGESKASVARDIGVPESTLRGWCKNAKKIEDMVHRQSSPVHDEFNHLSSSKRIKLEHYQAAAALGMLMTETNGALNLSTRSNSPSTSPCDSFDSEPSNTTIRQSDEELRQQKNVAILGKILLDPHLSQLCMTHYPNHQPIIAQLLAATATFIRSQPDNAGSIMNQVNTVLRELCQYIDLEEFAVKHKIDFTTTNNNEDELLWGQKSLRKPTQQNSPSPPAFPTSFVQMQYQKYLLEAQYLNQANTSMHLNLPQTLTGVSSTELNKNVGLLQTVRPISPAKAINDVVKTTENAVINNKNDDCSTSVNASSTNSARDIKRELELAEEKQQQLASLEQSILAQTVYLQSNFNSSTAEATTESATAVNKEEAKLAESEEGKENIKVDIDENSEIVEPVDCSLDYAKDDDFKMDEDSKCDDIPIQQTIQRQVVSINAHHKLLKPSSRRKNVHPQKNSPGSTVTVNNDVFDSTAELTKELALRQAENLLSLLECQQFSGSKSSDFLSIALRTFLVDLKGVVPPQQL